MTKHWGGVIVDERHGLQVRVEPLRWRVDGSPAPSSRTRARRRRTVTAACSKPRRAGLAASSTWFGDAEGNRVFRLGFGFLPEASLAPALERLSVAMDTALAG